MKKKKTLIAIIAVLLVVVVGATFAYYTSNTSFENVFNAGKYKVTLTEEFVSPDNWVPGETVPKTVTAKNDGTVDAAVRISYTEQWTKEIDGVETDITSQVSPNPAIINFANQGDWTLSNGYYYYNYILEPTKETSSFISGVTLDSTLNSVTCTGEGNTKTCEAKNKASGAKYKLTFTIQTIQYDVYESEWNTDVEIEKKRVVVLPTGRTKDNLEVGDEVCIYGITTECFDFVRYDENNDLVLLAKYNLNVGVRPRGGVETFIQDSELNGTYGRVGFSSNVYWYDYNNEPYYLKSKYGTTIPADVYDPEYVTAPVFTTSCNMTTQCYTTPGYSIAYYVEEYKRILQSYGATIEKARLLTADEITDPSIGCDFDTLKCPEDSFISRTSYWLSAVRFYSNAPYWVWAVMSDGTIHCPYYVYTADWDGVRPVIVISKSNI